MLTLNNVKQNLIVKFRKQDDNTKIIAKNIFWSALIKVVSISTNLLSVPLLLAYLNPNEYGIWLTMSAFLGWFGVFDLGIGNGLRNKLTEALTLGNYEDAKVYVSTAYAVLTGIFALVFVLFCIIGYWVSWAKVFNAAPTLENELFWATLLLFGSLCTQFVLKLISTVLIAHQNVAWSDGLNTVIQITLLFFIWEIGTYHTDQRLLMVSVIYGCIPIFLLLIGNFVFFRGRFKDLKPSFDRIKLSEFNKIGNLGFKFFFIQIAAVMIFATDNMLISHLFSPSDAALYNIAFKYFSIITTLFSIILASSLPMITNRYVLNDFEWIKKTMKKSLFIWFGLIAATVFQLTISSYVYHLWVKDLVQIPFSLSLSIALYCILFNLGVLYVNFINAVGKLRLQLYVSIVMMVVNPLIIIFYCTTLKIGLIGVPLGTISTILLPVILNYTQYRKIITKKSCGIWNY